MVVELKFPPVIENVKAHINRHKHAYSVATYVLVAGFLFVKLRGPAVEPTKVTIRPLTIFLVSLSGGANVS